VPKVAHFTKGAIWLKVNGQTKQNANLDQMIWTVAEQISKLSAASELMPGYIIYSGTPENVGPVVKGDVMEGHIDGLPDIRVYVADRAPRARRVHRARAGLALRRCASPIL